MPKVRKRIYKGDVMLVTYKTMYISAFNQREAWELAEQALQTNDPRIIIQKPDEPDLVDVTVQKDIESHRDIPYDVEDYVKLALVIRANEKYKVTQPIETSLPIKFVCRDCKKIYISKVLQKDATCPDCGDLYPEIWKPPVSKIQSVKPAPVEQLKRWDESITHPKYVYSGNNKIVYNCDDSNCECKKYY